VPHKGCPHDCVFCNQKRITGQIEDIDSHFVEHEIEKYLSTIPDSAEFVEVSFFGGSFTGLPVNEMISLLAPAKQAFDEGKIDAIRLSTRPDYIDEFILGILKKYSVSIIELGVQSMDDEVLFLSNRGHTVQDVYRSSKLIKENGFVLGLQMMVGLPGDHEESDIRTAEEFAAIGPDMARIYPALIIKDTYMEHMYKTNQYQPLSVDEAVDICSKVYLKLIRADIDIIRVGLQATENIRPGRDVVSGPYHPAFRELVESKIFNDMISLMYEKLKHQSAVIHINGRSLSKLYADKKKYFSNTLEKIGMDNLKVVVDNAICTDSIMLNDEENSLNMSIKDYSFII
jgi:histone acetyltransferase (RNA polymerase elongator complex component)